MLNGVYIYGALYRLALSKLS